MHLIATFAYQLEPEPLSAQNTCFYGRAPCFRVSSSVTSNHRTRSPHSVLRFSKPAASDRSHGRLCRGARDAAAHAPSSCFWRFCPHLQLFADVLRVIFKRNSNMRSYSRSRFSRRPRAPLRAVLLPSSRTTRHEFCNAYHLPNQSLVFVVFFGLKPTSDSTAKRERGSWR